MDSTVLDVRQLSVTVGSGPNRISLIHDCNLRLAAGSAVALVGLSGSGKTTLVRALLGLFPPGGKASGSISWRRLEIEGAGSTGSSWTDLLQLSARRLRKLRATTFGWIPQEPAAALDPRRTARQHILGRLRSARAGIGSEGRSKRVKEVLELVKIPYARANDYPHQWSGGMQQRLLFAMAIAPGPKLLIADEPTAALDTETQAQFISLLVQLQREHHLTLLLVTHDLSVAAALAQQVHVVNAGRLVESGSTIDLLHAPSNPAATALVEAQPKGGSVGSRRPAAAQQGSPILEFVSASAQVRHAKGVRVLVHDVSFEIRAGETLALVGPSGAGKSTVARLSAGLLPAAKGCVKWRGMDIGNMGMRERRDQGATAPMIFQDPLRSLDPTQMLGEIVLEGLRVRAKRLSMDRETHQRVASEWMRRIGLDAGWLDRRVHELSGGQRQRVAIARALAVEPQLLVADEPVTALDPITGRAILTLIKEMQSQFGVAVLLILHNLAQAAAFADRIGVLEGGELVEIGPAERVLTAPAHIATRRLLAAQLPWPPVTAAQLTDTIC